jgi:hypothetical protein
LDAAATATVAAAAAASGPSDGGAGNAAAASGISSRSDVRELSGQDDITLSNGVLEVTVGAAVGIKRVKVLASGRVHNYSSTLVGYEASGLFKQPGAYIFATQQESKVSIVLLRWCCAVLL